MLDLAFVPEGGTSADASKEARDLAQHAERWGYRRFWLAEHHNIVGIASAATAVVIGYVAANTRTIRVGAGGIMLPNHSPLVIAGQFGTLETLYPGRIDLGLGRAPGTDQRTLLALRRTPDSAESFPDDVLELQQFFEPTKQGQPVQAVPGAAARCATLDFGFKFIRRAARRDSGTALCIRFAFCACRVNTSAAGIWPPIQAIETT